MSNNKNCDESNIIIASILHDLCKVYYEFPPEISEYFSRGHGSKSVKLAEDYVGFELTDEERRAIRFHMGSKCLISSEEEAREYEKARSEELWELIHVGDCVSCGKYPKFMHSTVKNFIRTFKL